MRMWNSYDRQVSWDTCRYKDKKWKPSSRRWIIELRLSNHCFHYFRLLLLRWAPTRRSTNHYHPREATNERYYNLSTWEQASAARSADFQRICRRWVNRRRPDASRCRSWTWRFSIQAVRREQACPDCESILTGTPTSSVQRRSACEAHVSFWMTGFRAG